MSRRHHGLCALLLGLAFAACDGEEGPGGQAGADAGHDAGTQTDGGNAGDEWPSEWASKEVQVLELVNSRRTSGATCGGVRHPAVAPLQMNVQLREAARAHSEDMGRQGYFSHTGKDGSTPFQRIARAGYTGMPQGENIAAGNSSAEATVAQWMGSVGHCSNIMKAEFKSLGVGYAFASGSRYGHYWTQTFGGR